jgi:4-carboxymuconolactone decarboxylase
MQQTRPPKANTPIEPAVHKNSLGEQPRKTQEKPKRNPGKTNAAHVRSSGRETMRNLLAACCLATLIVTPQASRAEDITRFAPLKAEELNPAQKAWAEMIALPPRNAKFTNPPYRAYIRNPDLAPRLTALSEYLRWNTSLPPRLSELAILITARQWTAQYEWFAHYPLAIKGGLDPRVANDIAAGKRPTT